MKKRLLSLAIACFAFSAGTRAQVLWSQNFDAATIGALPASWTQASTALPPSGGWKTANWAAPTTTGWASATGVPSAAHATQIGLVDDWNDSGTSAVPVSNLHDTLMSPIFSLASSSTAWLNYDYYFFNAVTGTGTYAEKGYVIGSTDGGASWVALDTFDGWAWNSVWHTGHTNLAPLGASANAKVAFVYTDGGGHLLGLALDNIEAANLTASTGKVSALGYNSITNGISANGQSLAFLFENSGITVTSFTAKYTINGGAPVTQNFTGLSIAPYATQAFTFTTAMSGAVAGLNTVNVVVTDVNTVANTDVDSARSSTFTLASATTQRQGLVEEFSASTCAPCRAFNANYDPLCLTYNVNHAGTNVNVIKYQMNWPSPNDDRSYNNDGLTRRTYYSCNSIPDHWVNGVNSSTPASPFSATAFTTELDNSKALSSFMDMNIVYDVDTARKKLGVSLTVTPHFTKTGAYHVYIAVMDKHYQNTTNTTGQLEYYHVMRQMLPNGSGHAVTSWTDGVSQSFVDTGVAYTNGDWTAGVSSYPTQMSNKFWSKPDTGSEVVAFVEEDATKSVMQSVWTIPGMVKVTTTNKVENISLFPNPAKDQTMLSFNLTEAGNVKVTVMDYTGKVVSVVADKDMNIGVKNINISTKDIARGSYIVLISTENGTRAERLTVE